MTRLFRSAHPKGRTLPKSCALFVDDFWAICYWIYIVTRPLYYTLDSAGRPVLCRSVRLWARWMENLDNAKVRQDHVCTPSGDVLVSTIFMGLDHNKGEGAPVLWETKVIGLPEELVRKFDTRDAALAYHARLLGALQVPVPPQRMLRETHEQALLN